MRRYGCTLIPFLAFVLLTGCGNADKQLTVKPQPAPQSNVPPATSSPNGTNQEADVFQQLQVIISKAKEAREVTAFLDEHLKQVDSKNADQMFVALESFYEGNVPAVDDNFRNLLQQPGVTKKLYALEYPYDFNKIQNDDNLKQWLLAQTAGKLRLMATSDMSFYWQVDYEALQAAYASSLSNDLKDYLVIQSMEMKKGYSGDGALQISREELGKRMLTAENYLTAHPSGLKKMQVQTLYTDYLKAYLSDYRYEAIDESTMKLLPAVKKSYRDFVKTRPDSKTAEIVKEYIGLLQENQDVIYDFGQKDVSIIGDPKPNIAQFWIGLSERVSQQFGAAK
ncbi:ATP-binding protein [Brevibacillus choshinensis]|uniref:ATP-binding protein n=1 Tax=Brevibacillus choshinensis TaxID=54911 RepID=UPI002E1F7DCF|nr:ATP-binding protein [Brevibacillus choshinensis]